MPIVRSQANQKGGVGKTTTTAQLGHERAMTGKKVLLIDADSQRSLTKLLGLEPKVGQPTILALLTEPEKGIERAIVKYLGTPARPIAYSDGGCLHLIPGARDISKAPVLFDKSRDRQPVNAFEHVLPYLIKHFAQFYDEIFIDPSPSEDRVNAAVIYAADEVIAPVGAEPMALDGVQELLDNLRESNQARVALGLPGQTKLKAMLLTKVYPDQIKILKQMQTVLDSMHLPHFGQEYIPYTTAGWEAPAELLPIAVYAPQDAAALAYRAIAAQL